MEEVIFADEKHGARLYANALSCLMDRLNYNWWSPDEQAEAERLLDEGDEHGAWRFLLSREDYEYEHVELAPVINRLDGQ